MNQTTDVLEYYSAGLETLANQALQESTSAHEYVESAIRRGDGVASDLLRIREFFLNESDRARVAGLLPIGFFRELTGTKRITAFVVAVELSQRRGFQNLQPGSKNTGEISRFSQNIPICGSWFAAI